MRISLSWLRKYISFRSSPEVLAERLTMLGLEVERIDYLGKKYEGFVVGDVMSVSRHPNADKLTVCRVGVGGEELQIVCGAPNVAAGQRVAVGRLGAVVPRNQHDPNGAPFTLSAVKLRGIESFGMICSAYELDLGEDRDGILVLEGDAVAGTPLAQYLGVDDVALEIGVTPNRADALSHIGVAREVGVAEKTKVRIPVPDVKKRQGAGKIPLKIRLEAPDLCPRYTARVVNGVRVGPSPGWMQQLLSASGMRPVNNVVDVTNFVMLECGQPLHAFDLDRLDGGTIVVRRAAEGERLTTLDHTARTLKGDTLLICDATRPIAVAGVMGGENSEITGETKNIVIESACFNARSVRRSSKYLGLSTDASQRFERGTDIERTAWAADRVAQLLFESGAAEMDMGILDVYPRKNKARIVELRISKTSEILGVKLDRKTIVACLTPLGLSPQSGRSGKKGGDRLSFSVPSFRTDLEREIDLIEEVARVYGYDRIEPKLDATVSFPEIPAERNYASEVREALIGFGYQEVVTNSMQDRKVSAISGEQAVEIANPISIEMSALRTSLVPSMLRIIRNNIFQGMKDLRFLEIGKIYGKKPAAMSGESEFFEKKRMILGVSGSRNLLAWDRSPQVADLFDVKGDLEALFQKIFLDKINFIPYSTTKALTEKGLLVEINGVESGYLGMVSKGILKRFDIEQEVVVVELDLDLLVKGLSEKRSFRALSRFPSVLRDLALVVDTGTPVSELESEIRRRGNPYLTGIKVFDVYVGDQVSPGKKSIAFALEFLAEDHTLTQEEVSGIMEKILAGAKSVFRAEIRG